MILHILTFIKSQNILIHCHYYYNLIIAKLNYYHFIRMVFLNYG